MKALPLALVAGPAASWSAAAGVGNDVYPDERLHYSDTASSDAMSSSAAAARAAARQGLTGKGVTVGIVDSGCDGTHPDLADHITHNVTLLSPEYGNLGTSPQIVVPATRVPTATPTSAAATARTSRASSPPTAPPARPTSASRRTPRSPASRSAR